MAQNDWHGRVARIQLPLPLSPQSGDTPAHPGQHTRPARSLRGQWEDRAAQYARCGNTPATMDSLGLDFSKWCSCCEVSPRRSRRLVPRCHLPRLLPAAEARGPMYADAKRLPWRLCVPQPQRQLGAPEAPLPAPKQGVEFLPSQPHAGVTVAPTRTSNAKGANAGVTVAPAQTSDASIALHDVSLLCVRSVSFVMLLPL